MMSPSRVIAASLHSAAHTARTEPSPAGRACFAPVISQDRRNGYSQMWTGTSIQSVGATMRWAGEDRRHPNDTGYPLLDVVVYQALQVR